MGVAVEDADVKFILQPADHQAEGGLRDAASLRGSHEIAVTVYSYDVFELLKRHIIDFYQYKYRKYCIDKYFSAT